jgi:hypothetical protein
MGRLLAAPGRRSGEEKEERYGKERERGGEEGERTRRRGEVLVYADIHSSLTAPPDLTSDLFP